MRLVFLKSWRRNNWPETEFHFSLMIFGSIGLKRNIRLLVYFSYQTSFDKMNEVRCQDFLSRNNFLVPVSPVFPRSHKNVPAFPNTILLLFFALVISKNCATHGPSFKKNLAFLVVRKVNHLMTEHLMRCQNETGISCFSMLRPRLGLRLILRTETQLVSRSISLKTRKRGVESVTKLCLESSLF